jgi:hypothetical protein
VNFYKHFIGDYQRSTGDLSMTEHGAFRLMLDHFYGSGRPLPQDKKTLYRLLRAETAADRKAIDSVSVRYWRQLPDGLEPLYDWLNLHTEEERAPLRLVMVEWSDSGGLINVRALSELVKAFVISDQHRKIALNREANKRAAAAKKGDAT